MRTNAGFIIIASHRLGFAKEVVLGYEPETGKYVTWLCFNGTDYNYGHYGTDFLKAVADYRKRSNA